MIRQPISIHADLIPVIFVKMLYTDTKQCKSKCYTYCTAYDTGRLNDSAEVYVSQISNLSILLHSVHCTVLQCSTNQVLQISYLYPVYHLVCCVRDFVQPCPISYPQRRLLQVAAFP